MRFCGGIGAEILLPSAIGRLSAPQGSGSWRSFNAVVICRSRISCFCVRARPAPRRSRCRARACGRTFGPRRTPAPPIPPWKAFLADVVDILREEVAELVRIGATYTQLD